MVFTFTFLSGESTVIQKLALYHVNSHQWTQKYIFCTMGKAYYTVKSLLAKEYDISS